MTRAEALAILRMELSLLLHGEARGAAFDQLVADLDLAEGLLDHGYDALLEALPLELKPDLDRIVFSERNARRA